jgi:hypothetical protein
MMGSRYAVFFYSSIFTFHAYLKWEMETENGEMEVRNAAVKLYGNLQGKLMGKFD